MSKKPKLIVANDADLGGFKKIEGALETYSETGMECVGLVLYDRNIVGPRNPEFNPDLSLSWINFEFFKTHEGLHFVSNGCILEISGVRYLMLKDTEYAKEDRYRFSFYPQGFNRSELIELFRSEKIKATLWKPIKK